MTTLAPFLRAAPLVLLLSGSARAQDAAFEHWEPGNPTTSRVAGEVGEPGRANDADGVYGRFQGDLDIGLGAGVEADRDATRGAARLELHYFSMLGLWGAYSDAFGQSDVALRRLAAVGVDVRPAFIPRWSKNMEQGPGFVDLAIDSFELDAGAFWATPAGGAFGDRRGLELGVGFGLPLLGNARGPWLEARGLLRFADPARRPSDQAEGVFSGLLSWHEIVSTR